MKRAIQKKLGQAIKGIRIKKELTQCELAARAGKDQQAIQRLEAGKTNPTCFFIAQICIGLEIELDELFEEIKLTKSTIQ